ncbi:MAG: hypothetical protein V1897_17250 [Pseudomonadota bacterium]
MLNTRWPGLFLKWNPSGRWEIWEKYSAGALKDTRKIMDYRNADGRFLPLSTDHLVDLINRSDTRKWPLPERVKIWAKKNQDEKDEVKRDARNDTMAQITDDYNYIAGIKTFFMDPKSMPERVTTYTPAQRETLKRWGQI